jgi:hypothetical protein
MLVRVLQPDTRIQQRTYPLATHFAWQFWNVWEFIEDMIATFDIFRIESKSVRWLETADSLDEAKKLVREFAAKVPAEYLVLNQQTGTRLFIKPETWDAGGGNAPSTEIP